MIPPTSIDGTDITGATIDGTDVEEITVDGDVVFTAAPVIPPSGVTRLEFEQDYTDSWGNNDGSPVGSPSFVTDSEEGSFAVDLGTSDYVELPQNAFDSVYSGNEVSLSYYVKTSQSIGSTATHFSIEGAWLINLVDDDDGAVSTTFTGSSSNRIIGPTINDGSYHHVVAVYDGTDQILYVDGTEEARSSVSIFDITTIDRESAIGAQWDGVKSSDGIFDDPRVYSKGLNGTEVSNLYNTGSI